MSTSPGSDEASHTDRWIDARVVDAGGNEASIVSIEQTQSGPQAWVRLEQGTQVLLPLDMLAPRPEGGYRLPFTFNVSDTQRQPAQMTFPVMEEEAQVSRRVIDTGRGVRIHKTVRGREQVVDPPLIRDELEVEHVSIGRVIGDNEAPATRYDGDTLVVPVLEEVLVVQKQLLLKEEVRITRHRRPVRLPQRVELRSEQVTVERFDEGRETQT